MSVTTDPYRSNNLRASAWAALKASQRVIGRATVEEPTREDVLKAALEVAGMHMDEWIRAIDVAKEAAE